MQKHGRKYGETHSPMAPQGQLEYAEWCWCGRGYVGPLRNREAVGTMMQRHVEDGIAQSERIRAGFVTAGRADHD